MFDILSHREDWLYNYNYVRVCMYVSNYVQLCITMYKYIYIIYIYISFFLNPHSTHPPFYHMYLWSMFTIETMNPTHFERLQFKDIFCYCTRHHDFVCYCTEVTWLCMLLYRKSHKFVCYCNTSLLVRGFIVLLATCY